jgi:Ca-activated chloride channel family protein
MAAGNGAYLLDQERPNIFTLSVGNLNPGQEATIELEYVTLLPTHGGETRFSLPTTISPRYLPADNPGRGRHQGVRQGEPEFAVDVPYGMTLTLEVLGIEGLLRWNPLPTR